jgi:mono/diheme cytochrome c family protein
VNRKGSLAVTGIALALGAGLLLAQQAPDGAQLYTRNCASCHGAAGVPNATMVRTLGAIPDLTAAAMASVADSTLINTVTSGKNKMPAYRTRLTPEQVRAVVTYVRTLSHR